MKTLLIATRPEVSKVLATVLGPHFELILVTSLKEAALALDGGIDLILCSVYFGEGELYDLLRRAKDHPQASKVPFLVVNGLSNAGFSSAIRQSVDIATKTLGASQFIELTQWRDELGDDRAFEKLLGIVRRYLDPASQFSKV